MKKSASIVFGFFLFMQSTPILADSICRTIHISIQNNSSFDCVLTDFIQKEKNELNTTIFKNQSIQFDLSSTEKNLILRYQCGDEASVLLYFFQYIQSSARANYLSDQLKIKPKNLHVKFSKEDGVCNLFTPGSSAKWLLTIEDQKTE